MKKQLIFILIIISFVIIPQFSKAQTTGLVASYSFDEGSGTTVMDSSGNNNTGTPTNGPTWVAGKFGGALNFNGASNYVEAPNSSSLTITGDITISAWINRADHAQRTFVAKSNGSSHAYILEFNDVDQLILYSDSGGGFTCPTTIAALGTHFVAVTRSGSTWTCYWDGVSYGTVTNGTALSGAGYNLRIGGPGFGYWKGMIDEVRIFNRGLSQAEIQSDMNSSIRTEISPPPATPAPTSGMEQRCSALGANCVCSEPLNTLTYTPMGSSWYNPLDSTVKECSNHPLVPGGAVVRNSNDLFGTSDLSILSALPAGHTVSSVLRALDGYTGTWYTGQGEMPSGKKRYAFRWYIYHSPDFQFAGEGTAQNAKFAGWYNRSLLIDSSFGSIHVYNFMDWIPAQDCCGGGPGFSNVIAQDWRGKWWRAEVVVTNPEGKGATIPGSGPVVKLYLKNITDNGPEITVIDTSLAGTQLSPTTNFRDPPQPLTTGVIANHYRQNGGNGFEAISSYMAAAWDTDAGQRIGPAAEVEGSGAQIPPLPTPIPLPPAPSPSPTPVTPTINTPQVNTTFSEQSSTGTTRTPGASVLTSTSLPSTLSITKPLYLGVRDTQVSTLQTILIKNNYLKTATPTTYYGPLTQQAVKKFQCDKGIVCSGTPSTTGWGNLGPRTRLVLLIEELKRQIEVMKAK